jgi:hypothetical protein
VERMKVLMDFFLHFILFSSRDTSLNMRKTTFSSLTNEETRDLPAQSSNMLLEVGFACMYS